MSRYSAQIALIAYVLGGWLLPAAHQHHAHWHDDHGRSGACEHTHGPHAHDPHTHDGGRRSACHGHDHGDTNVVAKQAGEHQFLAGESTPTGCVGLCAFCSARTLSSPRLRDGTFSFAAATIARVLVAADPHWPTAWDSGTHFSRGPPTIV